MYDTATSLDLTSVLRHFSTSITPQTITWPVFHCFDVAQDVCRGTKAPCIGLLQTLPLQEEWEDTNTVSSMRGTLTVDVGAGVVSQSILQ